MQAAEPYGMSRTATSAAIRPLRVFLVEDSAILREHLTETLSSLEFVEVAGHADTERDAIAALRAQPFHAVVLDLQLKEGHGFNVLKALRAYRSTAHLVVLITLRRNTALAALRLGQTIFSTNRESMVSCASYCWILP